MTDIEREKYLFTIAKKVLAWADVEYNEEDLADLIMQDLINTDEEII